MVGSLLKTLHTLDLTILINEHKPVSESDKGTLAFFIRGILQWRQMSPWASCCALVAMCLLAPWHTTFLWKVSFNSDELFVCGARSDMFITHRKDMQRPTNRMVQRKRMLLTNSAWFLESKMSDWCQVFLSWFCDILEDRFLKVMVYWCMKLCSLIWSSV